MTRSNATGPTRRQMLKATAAGMGAISLGLPMLSGCKNDDAVPESYRYDITEAAKIDPTLITWRQVEHDLDLGGAADLFVDPWHLWVLQGAAVHLLSLQAWGTRQTWPLSQPGTAFAPRSDGLLVAVRDHVERLVQGETVERWPSLGDRAHITSITVDGDDLYIADAGNRQVIRYRGPDEVYRLDGFLVPSPYFDVAVHAGQLWVANVGKHQLECYDATGERVRSFGRTGFAIDAFCGCCNPCHFIVLPDGRFVTAEKGLHRVKVLKPDGTLDGVVAGAGQLGIDTNSPICMTPDCSGPAGPIPAAMADGRLAVVHPVTGKLHLFEEVG